jgi:hypothetical protein
MALGEKSRTPTLMNMYEEPQIADSKSSGSRYERLTAQPGTLFSLSTSIVTACSRSAAVSTAT